MASPHLNPACWLTTSPGPPSPSHPRSRLDAPAGLEWGPGFRSPPPVVSLSCPLLTSALLSPSCLCPCSFPGAITCAGRPQAPLDAAPLQARLVILVSVLLLCLKLFSVGFVCCPCPHVQSMAGHPEAPEKFWNKGQPLLSTGVPPKPRPPICVPLQGLGGLDRSPAWAKHGRQQGRPGPSLALCCPLG